MVYKYNNPNGQSFKTLYYFNKQSLIYTSIYKHKGFFKSNLKKRGGNIMFLADSCDFKLGNNAAAWWEKLTPTNSSTT